MLAFFYFLNYCLQDFRTHTASFTTFTRLHCLCMISYADGDWTVGFCLRNSISVVDTVLIFFSSFHEVDYKNNLSLIEKWSVPVCMLNFWSQMISNFPNCRWSFPKVFLLSVNQQVLNVYCRLSPIEGIRERENITNIIGNVQIWLILLSWIQNVSLKWVIWIIIS